MMVAEFDRRRKAGGRGAERLARRLLHRAEGGLLRLPQHQAQTGWKAKKLASALLEETGVATIGGPDFGVHGEGYIRLSYANSLGEHRARAGADEHVPQEREGRMSFGSASYLYLAAAIVSEVIGTSALKASNEFTRPVPTVIMLAAFLSAFYFLTLTLRTIPVGVAYAIWSGVGIVMISIIARILFGQKLDAPAILGMALIVAGVLVINLFSKSTAH
jgi:small multidrug resistance pump